MSAADRGFVERLRAGEDDAGFVPGWVRGANWGRGLGELWRVAYYAAVQEVDGGVCGEYGGDLLGRGGGNGVEVEEVEGRCLLPTDFSVSSSSDAIRCRIGVAGRDDGEDVIRLFDDSPVCGKKIDGGGPSSFLGVLTRVLISKCGWHGGGWHTFYQRHW